MTQLTRAIGVMEFGGAEKLQVLEVPIEHAGPGQVRVRVHAAAGEPDRYLYSDGSTCSPGRRAEISIRTGNGCRWGAGRDRR